MNDTLNQANAAASGSILAGGQVGLRYLFVLPARWNSGGPRTSTPEVALDLVHAEIGRSSAAARYVDPLTSFYADVTIPFTSRRRLPVAALIEPLAPESGAPGAHPRVEIEIGAIETAWEGHTATVSPTRILAQFTDAITLFDSGHVVYTPAFVMQSPWGIDEAPSRETNAQHLSALTSLVGTPGVSYHRGLDGIRSSITFRFEGEASGQSLVGFISRRLALLCDENSVGNVFADLIRPVLRGAGWRDAQRAKVRATISSLSWEDVRSASVEIVGAVRHDDIVAVCRAAKTGTMAVGAGERALAALGQNVLDVHNQDEHEVIDSLSQAIVSDEHVLLIHPTLAVLYSRKSRSFAEMCDAIGGCPYVMLTNIILAYNEYLLEQSARLIDQTMQAIRNPRWADARGAASAKAVREDLAARVQLFENQTLHVLPNVFRYPAERTMFDEIVSQRGLSGRAAGIERFTRNLYELRKDFIDLAEREGTRRTNRLLMALGIVQVSGLFLAALGLEELKGVSTVAAPEGVRAALWVIFAISLVVGALVAARAFRR
jgi:hypothetical protein